MRHTRSGAGASNKNSRQGQAAPRAQQHHQQLQLQPLDSPARLKRSGGPSMSAERFLLIVAQLQAQANDLWEREQIELQRGAELMVISCAPSPPSPMPQRSASPQAADSPPSPVTFHHAFDSSAALLHSAQPHVLASPSLIPAAHTFGSPTWSSGFDALAVQMGFMQPSTTDAGDEAAVGTSHHHDNSHQHHQQQHHQQHQQHSQQQYQHQQYQHQQAGLQQGHGHHSGGHQGQGRHAGGCDSGQGSQPHPSHHLQHPGHHQAGPDAPHGHVAQLSGWPLVGCGGLQPLALYHDAEALITLCGPGGGSATARTAKARLLDKFDTSVGSGTATARQGQSCDPFAGLLSGTPGADDFLGSPSWGHASTYL